MRAVYKKETGSFYRSMIGYLYTAFVLAVTGVFFTVFNLRAGMTQFGYALGNTTVLLLIGIPILTMRSFAGEFRQGTAQLLFTEPVKPGAVVMGKFLAILTQFCLPLVPLALCPVILSAYGKVSFLESYACFLAYILMGMACISIGMFVSSLTEHMILAAAGTFALLLASYLMNALKSLVRADLRQLAAGLFEALSLFQRYYDFTDGMFMLRHVIYYLGVTAMFLYFTKKSVERAR